MALNCIFPKGNSLNLLKQIIQIQQTANASGAAAISGITMGKIGKREIVGYGLNGQPSYIDRVDVPFPAVRFRELTPDIQMLREKEKGDWHKLSIEEKKALYRASYCQTLVEVQAPNGDWKGVIGVALIGISTALWLYILMKVFVYPPLPASFAPEKQKAQLKKMIDLRMGPVDGIASKWDYEKGQWKE